MKRKIIRLSSALGLVILYLFFTVSPVFAIDSPTTFTINSVTAYYDLIETDDQLYLVDYTIDYDPDGNPLTDDNPDENITEAYLVRLMDGVDELGSQAPYAYYDEGYDRGVVAIYFSASEAPVWAGSYTLRLEGNPMLTWAAARPLTSTTTIIWSTGSSEALASKILWMADTLEVTWSVDLIENTGQGSRLTTYGESYFSSAIPYLTLMCPNILSGSSTSPTYPDRSESRAAGDYLRTRVNGTLFDPAGLAAGLGTSANTLGIGASFILIILGLVLFAKQVPASGILMLMATILMIGATLAGWMPLFLGVFLAVLGCVAILYVFLLEKASA